MKESSVKKYFSLAEDASKFSDYRKEKVGCVFVYKNKTISVGYNTTKENPLQKYYNRYRGYNVDSAKNMVHAEMMCILKIKDMDIDFSKLHIFVYRKHKNGINAISKPCPACMQALKDLGIKNIHYTGEDSFIYEKIN